MPSPSNRRTPTKVRARRDTLCIDEIPTRDTTDWNKEKGKHGKRRCSDQGERKRRSRSHSRKRLTPETVRDLCQDRTPNFKRSRSEETRSREKIRRQKVTDYILSSAVRHATCFRSRNNSAAFSDSDASDIYNSCLSKNIIKLWKNGQLCDVVIHAEGKRFYAHRLVMATACEYFAHQKTSESSVTEIHVPNVSAETIAEVVNYFYTSKISIHDQNVREMLEVSHHLGITEVLNMCVNLLSKVTLSNAVRNMHLAHSFNLAEVMDKINKYVIENFGSLVNNESFLRSEFKVVNDIIASEILAPLGDIQSFLACTKWIDFDRSDRLRYAVALMSLIRFGKVPSQELAEHVETVDFMNDIPECKEMLYTAFRHKALFHNEPILAVPTPPKCNHQFEKQYMINHPESKHALNPEGYDYKPMYTLRHYNNTIAHTDDEDRRMNTFQIPLLRSRETVTGIRPPADMNSDNRHEQPETNVDTEPDPMTTANETDYDDTAKPKHSHISLSPRPSTIQKGGTLHRVKSSVKDFTERVLNMKPKHHEAVDDISQRVSSMSIHSKKISRDDLVKEFPETDDNQNRAKPKSSSKVELIKRLSGHRVLPVDDEGPKAGFSDISLTESYPQGKHISAVGAAHHTKPQHSPRGLSVSGLRHNPSQGHVRSSANVNHPSSANVAQQTITVESGSKFVNQTPETSNTSLAARSSHKLNAMTSEILKTDQVSHHKIDSSPSIHFTEMMRPSQVKLSDSHTRHMTERRLSYNRVPHTISAKGGTSSTNPSSSENELMEVVRRVSKSRDMTGNSCHTFRRHNSDIYRGENHDPDCPIHQIPPKSQTRHMSLSPITSDDSRALPEVSLPPPPTPRVIMVMGGVNPYQDCHTITHESNSIQQFDPKLNSWSIRTHLPTAIHHFAVAEMGGKVYVTGGQMSHSEDVSPLKECHYYDVRRDRWHTISGLKTARSNHVAVNVHGAVYVLGGEDCMQMSLKTVEVYNSDNDQWEFVAPMKDSRTNLSAIAHRGRIFVVGGMLDIDEKFLLDSVEVFDPKTGQWGFRFPLPISICDTCLVEVEGVIFMVGGYVMKDKEPLSLDSVFRYCDETDTWEGFDTLHVPRHNAIVAALDNRMYIIGGESTAAMGHALSNVECIDVENESHVTGIAPLLAPAYGIAGCVFDSR